MKKRPYESLSDWLDRTGTKQRDLAEMAGLKESTVSMLLRGSRRCSVMTAIKLSDLTGVPVQKLIAWPQVRTPRNTNAAA